MMSRHSKATAFHPVRYDRLPAERQQDPYRSEQKYPEPTVCPECGAVFQAGRWQWAQSPAVAHAIHCPACRRISDDLPLGYVHLSGDYFQRHQKELMHLLENQARREESHHALERIMAVRVEGDSTVITTTGFHMARRLAEALHQAHRGELNLDYSRAEDSLRIYWRR